jgi:uncharacterized protein YaaW (UPF0174 family)
MMRILFSIIICILIVGFNGCDNDDMPSNEYRYLRDFIKQDSKWENAEYTNFIHALNEKHIIELAYACGVGDITDNSIVNDSKNPKIAINRNGGREKLEKMIVNDIIWDYSNAITYPFKSNEVPYHEIAYWTAEKMNAKVNSEMTTFDMEKTLILSNFSKAWDNLSEEQRKQVIKDSALNKLSDSQKSAIIAGSWTVAVATISTTALISGFAFYTTMSSVVATCASVIGVTLPFAAYSGMSTVVGIISGPVGWTIIGIGAVGTTIWSMGANENETMKDVLAIHMMKVKALQ